MSGVEALYQESIKVWARADHAHGTLDAASGEARLDNPLCGDRVRMQVRVTAGRIDAIAQDTRGCLLCRAAASLLGQRAAGQDADGIAAATAALEAVLVRGEAPPAAWPELDMFVPAKEHASRHKCALLPFRALQDALRSAAGNPVPVPTDSMER